jgi:hypothetical protein
MRRDICEMCRDEREDPGVPSRCVDMWVALRGDMTRHRAKDALRCATMRACRNGVIEIRPLTVVLVTELGASVANMGHRRMTPDKVQRSEEADRVGHQSAEKESSRGKRVFASTVAWGRIETQIRKLRPFVLPESESPGVPTSQ